MQFDVQHNMSVAEVTERLHALGDYLQNRHGIQVSWSNGGATFRGRYLAVRIEGELTITDSSVSFNGKDPGLLLRGRATKYLRGKLDIYLDPETEIDSLPRG